MFSCDHEALNPLNKGRSRLAAHIYAQSFENTENHDYRGRDSAVVLTIQTRQRSELSDTVDRHPSGTCHYSRTNCESQWNGS